MSRAGLVVAVGLAAAALAGASGRAAAAAAQPGADGPIGRAPSAEEVATWDIAVGPDGKELPPGRGTADEGRRVYGQRCVACHGPTGQEGPMDHLAGGRGSLATDQPVKTVGSYWPYPTTLFDYIRRAMPFDRPGTLTDQEVYDVTAYVLFLNGIIGEREVIDARTLPQVRMPNRDGFVPDPRPDVAYGPVR